MHSAIWEKICFEVKRAADFLCITWPISYNKNRACIRNHVTIIVQQTNKLHHPLSSIDGRSLLQTCKTISM